MLTLERCDPVLGNLGRGRWCFGGGVVDLMASKVCFFAPLKVRFWVATSIPEILAARRATTPPRGNRDGGEPRGKDAAHDNLRQFRDN